MSETWRILKKMHGKACCRSMASRDVTRGIAPHTYEADNNEPLTVNAIGYRIPD